MGVEPFFIANALTGVVSQRLVRIVCKICKGKGCVQCSHSGYKKRVGLFEIVRIGEKMKELVLRRASADELRVCAMEHGMISFAQSIAPLLEQGLTTKEEVDRVLSVD
jgi:general secretion pathway protein E